MGPATMAALVGLYACTKCNARHPFEELSQGQQLCKECRGAYPIVKCTYCRTEFQQENKGNTSTICKKCEQNVKLYGKPSACEYCNIIAAFIGTKCQRCTNSEKKYGPPLTCEQCKQRCAFDRQDDSRKKVDGKLLCWLCTLSYKRALAKAKQNDPMRHTNFSLHKSSGSSGHHRSSSGHKSKSHHSSANRSQLKHQSSSSSGGAGGGGSGGGGGGASNSKKPRLDSTAKTSSNGPAPSSSSESNKAPELTSSDHMVAVTQLREQIAVLQKQLSNKDQALLAKDRQITDIKALHRNLEKELRTKMTNMQKQNTETVQTLHTKVKVLAKQVSTLSKGKKPVDSPQITS